MTHRINTAMKMVQAGSLDPPGCGALVEPGVAELFHAHYSVLACGDPGYH